MNSFIEEVNEGNFAQALAWEEEGATLYRRVGDIWPECDVGRRAEERNLEERWVFDRHRPEHGERGSHERCVGVAHAAAPSARACASSRATLKRDTPSRSAIWRLESSST